MRFATPIFVMGYMHSGTSLIKNILEKNAIVYDPGHEVQFFMHINSVCVKLNGRVKRCNVREHVRNIIRDGFGKWNQKVVLERIGNSCDKWDGSADEMIELYLGEFSSLARENECEYFIDKSDAFIWYIESLLETLQNFKVLIILRDPRDVLASKKKRKLTTTIDRYQNKDLLARKKLEKKFSVFWDAISLRKYLKLLLKIQDNVKLKDKIVVVKYEDLVEAPIETVRSICSFIEIEFSEEMLNVTVANASDNKVKRDRGIYKSIGNYNNVFSVSEKMFLEQCFKRILGELGYESNWKTLYSLMRFPLFIWFGLRGLGEGVNYIYSRYKLLGRNVFKEWLLNHFKFFRSRGLR